MTQTLIFEGGLQKINMYKYIYSIYIKVQQGLTNAFSLIKEKVCYRPVYWSLGALPSLPCRSPANKKRVLVCVGLYVRVCVRGSVWCCVACWWCVCSVRMHCGVARCGVQRLSACVFICVCVCTCVPAATHTPWGPHPGGPHPGATAYTRRR